MLFSATTTGSAGESATLPDSSINFFAAKASRLALSLCASLHCRSDGEATRVAEWFYPELKEYCSQVRGEALTAVLAGQQQDGDLDMAGFVEADPALAGYVSTAAHGLFKLTVAISHAEQQLVSLSPGDCNDIQAMLATYRPTLEQFGLLKHGPVAAAVLALVDLFSSAADVGAAVVVSPG